MLYVTHQAPAMQAAPTADWTEGEQDLGHDTSGIQTPSFQVIVFIAF